MNSRIALSVVLFLIAALPSPGRAQGRPFTLEELKAFVTSGVIAESRMVTLVGERCLAFQADDAALGELRATGASEPVLAAVRRACRVLPGEPRWIQVTPDTLDVTIGKTVRLRVTALAPDSTPIENTFIRWTSSDSSVVAVGADGALQARLVGFARVTAMGANGISSEPATILVTYPAIERKSTTTAILLGTIVPGGGQFYTGQGLKGALLFAGSIATAVAGLAVTTDDVSLLGPEPPSCTPTCTYTVNFEKKRPAVIPTLIAAGGLWAYGILDAMLQARATQEARGPMPEMRFFAEARVNPDGTVDVPLIQIAF